MKSRLLVAAVGVPLTLIMLVLLPDLGAAIFCAAISCVAVQEMYSAVGVRSRQERAAAPAAAVSR